MQAFLIELVGEVGELARVTEAIAAKDINIVGFSGASYADFGTAVVTVDDADVTRLENALIGIPVGFREYELVTVALDDVPGKLAGAARKLADAEVSVEAAIATGMQGNDVIMGFAVGDPGKARDALA